jgi:hypothetical protein
MVLSTLASRSILSLRSEAYKSNALFETLRSLVLAEPLQKKLPIAASFIKPQLERQVVESASLPLCGRATCLGMAQVIKE